MTQEDKNLLLRDLSARLPYHVRCKVWLKDGTTEEGVLDLEHNYGDVLRDAFYYNKIVDIKPFLRPISSMTDDEMDRLFDILHIDKDGNDEDWIKINDIYGIKFFFPTGKWIEDVAEAYAYLYSIHIDFRGLIRKGLAIEVTEENNLYET